MYCRLISRNKTGFTLVELTVVVALEAVIAVMAMWLLLFGTQTTVSTTMLNRFDRSAQAKLERIKNDVRGARSISVNPAGEELKVVRMDGPTVTYEYRDKDGNPSTKADSCLVRKSGMAEQVEISHIDRATSEALFSYAGGRAPLQIRMRLGDSIGDRSDRSTGPGVQAIDIVTSVTCRNVGL